MKSVLTENPSDILSSLALRLPCRRCGQDYDVPLSDILLSHSILVHGGCPAPQETECPPVFQDRLLPADRLADLQRAWERLRDSALRAGGHLVLQTDLPRPSSASLARKESSITEHVQTGQAIAPHLPPGEQYFALDFGQEVEVLHQSDSWQKAGLARMNLVRFPDFHLNLIALRVGRRIEQHNNPGRISVQTLAGHIRMRAAGQTFDLPKGKALVLDRAVTHDVEAVGEDSAFLLTIALPDTH